MADSFYLAAYWGIRKESAAQGARRATEFLARVGEVAPTPIRWMRIGLDPEDLPEREITLSEDSFEELFMAGRHRRDCDRTVLEKLGMHLCLTARAPSGDPLRIEVVCGAHTAATQNFCRIDFLACDESEDWLQAKTMRSLLHATARAWQPDWAAAITHEYRDELPPEQLGRPLVGWMLYLDASRGAVPRLPAPATVEALGGLGNLIVTVPETFTCTEARHLTTARSVQSVLDEVGLLEAS